MPRARLLWASGKQTIQYIESGAIDLLPVERDEQIHTFRAIDRADDENLPVYREVLPDR